MCLICLRFIGELFFDTKIGFSRLPLFGYFHKDGSDEPEDRVRIWKKSCDLGSAFDLVIEVFAHIGGAQSFALVLGQTEPIFNTPGHQS